MTSQDSTPVAAPRARYWRSLSELHRSDDFNKFLDREFPVAASEFPEGVSRRRWLQLMSASLAVAGVTGCRYPEETIAPFVLRPEGRVPGETYSRATNFELAGRVYNLLITCIDGRPLKIEPNTEHPSGLGTDAYVQASILSLFDPDRSRSDDGPILRREQGEKVRRVASDWDTFNKFGENLLRTSAGNTDGSMFAVVMEPTASPSTLRMLGELRKRLPKATFVRFDGVHGDAMRDATKKAFGKPARQVLDLSVAKTIVSIQADILGTDSGFLRNARGFSQHRDAAEPDSMSRLYVVEGGYTATGVSSDARLALRPSQMPAFLSELSRRVDKLKGGETHEHGPDSQSFDEISPADRLERFIDTVAHDLAESKGDAVVVVGEHLGSDAIAAGIALNQKLGSLGKIQKFVAEPDSGLGELSSLGQLVEKIDAGQIDSLLILGGNPVFAGPSELKLQSAIAKVENSIYLGEYDDETAAVCGWSLPQAHPLESWGDVVDDDGHYGVCQPQILPLLGGRSTVEVLATMLGERDTTGEAIVRRTAEAVAGKSLSEREWRQLLHDGFSDSVKASPEMLSKTEGKAELVDAAPVAIDSSAINQDDIDVLFMVADGIYDGRFANNGWLQEMPQSLTKLTWDNTAMMSPKTAAALKIKHGLMVAIRRGDSKVELPVYEVPGIAPGVISVTYGYGRTRAGAVGGSEQDDIPIVGTDVSAIRQSDSMLTLFNAEARPNLTEFEMSATQDHWAIDERGKNETESRSFTLVREGTVALYNKIPNFAEAKGPHVPKVGREGSPWKEPINQIEIDRPRLPQWGMAIDLSKCIGCNACVIACQSENNVPIVGKEQVRNSREMHWLRVDSYFQGDEENADVVQQPVACMHCETAPCEQVCPVAATVHTDEGINAMAYNRCIGTRYCANNCPFKVRRFNYFNYNTAVGVGYGIDAYEGNIESANRKLQALVLSPNVTVRGRGVMEKCTYCVQRVEQAKIEARKDGGRAIRDGDVITACQSACPTRAIDFGNIADPDSVVAKKRQDARAYGMLEQLNVKPRTEYLARVRNTPPRLMNRFQLNDLASLKAPHHGGHGETHHGDGHGSAAGHDDHGHNDHADDDHGHEQTAATKEAAAK
jgi:MoCo/4Fe-4S cofactor protein with predicted Tat translocation signal